MNLLRIEQNKDKKYKPTGNWKKNIRKNQSKDLQLALVNQNQFLKILIFLFLL